MCCTHQIKWPNANLRWEADLKCMRKPLSINKPPLNKQNKLILCRHAGKYTLNNFTPWVFFFLSFFFVFSILCFVSFYYTFSCQAIHSHFFKKVAHLLATVAGACQISVPTSTGLTEVRVQVPFRTNPLEFFPPYCLSSAHDCEDHFHWNCFNLQIKSMSLMYSLYQECLWIQ